MAAYNPQLSVRHAPGSTAQRLTAAVLRMRLVGANAKAKITGLEELPSKSNYFVGNDPKEVANECAELRQGEKR